MPIDPMIDLHLNELEKILRRHFTYLRSQTTPPGDEYCAIIRNDLQNRIEVIRQRVREACNG